MNGLKIFENPKFGKVRAIEQNGEAWFVAADVCRALDIINPSDAIKKLDDDERARFNLGHPMNETNCVNEPGLYSLVLGSRKPEAKAFKRWITHEVLPAIRKQGAYVAPDAAQVVVKAQPEVSLVGLARVATVARKAVLDMGGSRWEAGAEVLSILSYCGLPVPAWVDTRTQNMLKLEDFF